MSLRAECAGRAYIDDVVDSYEHLDDLTSFALGSSGWGPPDEAVHAALQNTGLLVQSDQTPSSKSPHRYGSVMGDVELRELLKTKLRMEGLSMECQEVMITCGAQQAFANFALALTNPGEYAIVFSPYYFSHKQALELAGLKVITCPFDSSTLRPDTAALKSLLAEYNPVLIVLCNPSNPAGIVFNVVEIENILDTLRDVFFFTVVGLLFLALFGWILIIFLPYYFGRAIWEKFELWYINRLQK